MMRSSLTIFFALILGANAPTTWSCPVGTQVAEANRELSRLRSANWEMVDANVVQNTQPMSPTPPLQRPKQLTIQIATPTEVTRRFEREFPGSLAIERNALGKKLNSWASTYEPFTLASVGDARNFSLTYGENAGRVMGFWTTPEAHVMGIPKDHNRVNKGIGILNKYLPPGKKIKIRYRALEGSGEAADLEYIRGTKRGQDLVHPYASGFPDISHDAAFHTNMIGLTEEAVDQFNRNGQGVGDFLDFLEDEVQKGGIEKKALAEIRTRLIHLQARQMDTSLGNFSGALKSAKEFATDNAYNYLLWKGASSADYLRDLVEVVHPMPQVKNLDGWSTLISYADPVYPTSSSRAQLVELYKKFEAQQIKRDPLFKTTFGQSKKQLAQSIREQFEAIQDAADRAIEAGENLR